MTDTIAAPDVAPSATPAPSRWAAFARSWWAKVLLLTLLGLGVRLVYVAAFPRCDFLSNDECSGHTLSGDAAYYHNAANLLADGEGFIDPYRFINGGYDLVPVEMADGTIQEREVITPVGHREPTAGHPPAYLVFLGAVSWLGARSVVAHQIASAVLGAAAIPLIALVGRRLVGDRVGLIAGGLAALYTMLWINDGLVMSETAVVVVVPIIMLAGLRFGRSPDVRSALLFGAAGALGALTRAELALFLPVVAAVVLLRAAVPWSRRIGLYAICGFTALAVVSPWVIRNMTAFEHRVYLSNGAGTVMVQTNCDATYYGPDIGYWNLWCGSPMPYGPNGELLDESERDVVVRERALDYISNHKVRLVTAAIPARVARMFSILQPIRQLDLEVLSEERPYRISAAGLVQYYALVALAVGGAAALWRRRLPLLPIAIWFGLVAFTAAFAFGNMRYRVSAEPALVVLAAVGIDALWCRFRPRPVGQEAGTLAAHPIVSGAERPVTALHRAWGWFTATTARRGVPWHRWTDAHTPPATAATGKGVVLPKLPALDGLRGLAVIGVLLFHGGYSWAKGGFLGVSAFFTLSGFLITNLLVREHDRTGTIRLGAFWTRRFRRLLPAALAALLGVAIYGSVFASAEQLADLRGDMLAALFYVANWRFLFSGQSYGELFSAPSPVLHFWSLAIEEQFYVFFPLVVFAALRVGRRRALWCTLGASALVSLALGVALADDVDQVYYGTHTRAFELLAGALLALWWSGRRTTAVERNSWFDRPAATAGLSVVGSTALVAMLYSWTRATETSEWLGRGGLAAHALLVVVIMLAIARKGPLARLLSFAPLRWIGLISYGLYLYHWPVFLVLDAERTGMSTTPLFALRTVVTLVLALLSYFVIEVPIRRGVRLASPRRVVVAAPLAVFAVLAATITVTHDPPVSQIAYANVKPGEWKPVVDVVDEVELSADQPYRAATPGPVPMESGVPEAMGQTPNDSIIEAGAVAPLPTVLIVGDSGMADTAPAIGAAFKAAGTTKVIDASNPGTGLTSDWWYDDWSVPIVEHDPDLVVVMLGGWDIDELASDGDAKYTALVDSAVQLFTSNGARVLWLSMLPGGTTPDRPVDRIYAQLPQRYPGVVEYVDIEAALRGPNGDWPRAVTTADGVTQLWRKPDNWHMCPDGAARVALAVMGYTASIAWAPQPAVEWQNGDWRTHPRYDDPRGGCVIGG